MGAFDFALANPPFNVNAVDKDRLKDSVGPGRRYPFGLPRTDNANYLWIQLFYSSLNEKGRAGFVMANSASDARSSEMELRKQLIEARAVDAVVAVGPNMFYTVTLPCTLWFLDRGKKKIDRAPTRCCSSMPATSTARSTAPIATGMKRRSAFSPMSSGSIVAKSPISRSAATKRRRSSRRSFGKKPKYVDVAGLCKAATLKEIEAQGWSLNPGRYVGVAPGEEVSDEDFKEQLETLNEELETLNAQARELEQTIAGTWRRFWRRDDGRLPNGRARRNLDAICVEAERSSN